MECSLLMYLIIFVLFSTPFVSCDVKFAFSNGPLTTYNGTQQQRAELRAFFDSKIASRSARNKRYVRNLISKSHNESAEAITAAKNLVVASLVAVGKANKARVRNPLRNTYISRHSAAAKEKRDNASETSYPLFPVNSTLAAAAALVAESHAKAKASNGTLFKDYSRVDVLRSEKLTKTRRYATGSSYWLAEKEDLGAWPYHEDPSFVVFRNVLDYGVIGDGVTDDTAAINAAISDGRKWGSNCESSSCQGVLIFFPAGTYLVSGSIITYYNTQLVGDPKSLPVIIASASFVGLGVISTNVYINCGDGAEWYVEQSNFYRQIRNFYIDITDTPQSNYVAAIHYQAAQATSIMNVVIIADTSAGTTQLGIYTENGSGGFMSDVMILGGAFGLYAGDQQFTTRNLVFSECVTAIQLTEDWGWTWQGLQIFNSSIGISLLGVGGVTRGTSSLTLVDSYFSSVQTAILMAPPIAGAETRTTGILMSNVAFNNVTSSIKDSSGYVWLPGSIVKIHNFNLGKEYSTDHYNQFSEGSVWTTDRDSRLTYDNYESYGLPYQPYFQKSMPQYEETDIEHVLQLKWLASGDGVTDDTIAVQVFFDFLSGTDYIGYIDAGSYIISNTVTLLSDTRIVGECWAQFVASGANFKVPIDPIPLLQVGNKGDIGNVEIQQVLFTTTGATQGLLALEWNMLANAKGSAALWDSHVRIGGAAGTELQVEQCPARSINDNCIAAAAMMHITAGASGYFENMWLWTADHDIDDALNRQINVFTGRGLLVQSKDPVWLYGTASEHAAMYQYTFQVASTIVASMIQTETPHYQPNPTVPSPFDVNGMLGFMGDPQPNNCWPGGEGCDSAYAVRFYYASNIKIYGAGLYSFFQDYNETCVSTQNCQSAIVSIEKSYGGIAIFNLITVGAKNMLAGYNTVENQTIAALNNTSAFVHPYWSLISYLEGPRTPSGWSPIQSASDDLPSINYTVGRKAFDPYWNVVPTAADGSPIIPPECVVDPVATAAEGFTMYNCTYLGQTWDEYLLDEGYACDCNEDECSVTSPNCCTEGECPVCDCTEDSCSDFSPFCCDDDSCQWATTESAESSAATAKPTRHKRSSDSWGPI